MPGFHITDRQVRRYMASRKAGHTQAASAARAGFSESTGRRVEKASVLPSQRPPRQYRTRADPFHEVWRQDVVPLLEKVPAIRATTVLEELQRLHPRSLSGRGAALLAAPYRALAGDGRTGT